jgi:hypothetical protein
MPVILTTDVERDVWIARALGLPFPKIGLDSFSRTTGERGCPLR